MELPNGCICCTVKDRRAEAQRGRRVSGASLCDSFLQTLEALLEKRDRLDCILVETTGA